MDVKILYQDDNFIVYAPETFAEFKTVCGWYIPNEAIFNEWLSNYTYIFSIVSKEWGGKGYLYIPANSTFVCNIDKTSLPQISSLDVFAQTFDGVGKFLFDLSYDVLAIGQNFIVRHEKLTLQKNTYVIIYAESFTYIYTSGAKKMNGRMLNYLKNHREILDAVGTYINKDILAELQ